MRQHSCSIHPQYKRRAIYLLVFLVELSCLIFQSKGMGADQSCIIEKGLFTRFEVLEGRIGLQEQAEILCKYRSFLSALTQAYSNKDNLQISKCFRNAQADPIASLMCALIRYLSENRRNSGAFLSALPKTKKEMLLVWYFEELFYGYNRILCPGEIATDLMPSGPSSLFAEEIGRLVLSGNRQALLTWFRFYKYADGYFAEEMDDRTIKLIANSPTTFLSNWDAIERAGLAPISIGETCDQEDVSRAITEVSKYNVQYPRACKGLLAILTNSGQTQEPEK